MTLYPSQLSTQRPFEFSIEHRVNNRIQTGIAIAEPEEKLEHKLRRIEAKSAEDVHSKERQPGENKGAENEAE